jgi:pimeloyl-ACP methyl ester carboxylesterase
MTLLRFAMTVASVLIGLTAYLLAVRAHYRLRGPRPACTLVQCPDGYRIAVHHRQPAVRRFQEPVLLCHGLAASHLNFDFEPPHSLAQAFAEAGFEVFSVDWRGAGASRPARGWNRFRFDADDLITQDAPTLLSHALQTAGSGQAFWVGHSLGALVGYGLLGGAQASRLRGLCALGAPVFFRIGGWPGRLMRLGVWLAWPWAFRQRWLSIGLAPFLGHVTLPLTETLINPKAIAPRVLRQVYANLVSSMGHRLLRQLADWSRHDVFRSRDGRIDYRGRLREVTTPVLVLGGSQDALATPRAVLGQAELLGSSDKTVMLFGRENGDALDYGHGDLIFGERAPQEVYPRIITWVTERATRLNVDQPESGAAVAAARAPG